MDIEKRREPRYPYYSAIDFSLVEKGDELLRGFVVNMSDSGLCIHSFVPLSEGQEITVVSDLPSKHRRFNVRWRDRLFKDSFTVGLSAVE